MSQTVIYHCDSCGDQCPDDKGMVEVTAGRLGCEPYITLEICRKCAVAHIDPLGKRTLQRKANDSAISRRASDIVRDYEP